MLMEENKVSSMRCMSVMSLITAIVFGYIVLTSEAPTQDGPMLVIAFLVGAFAPKAVQKFAEKQL